METRSLRYALTPDLSRPERITRKCNRTLCQSWEVTREFWQRVSSTLGWDAGLTRALILPAEDLDLVRFVENSAGTMS